MLSHRIADREHDGLLANQELWIDGRRMPAAGERGGAGQDTAAAGGEDPGRGRSWRQLRPHLEREAYVPSFARSWIVTRSLRSTTSVPRRLLSGKLQVLPPTPDMGAQGDLGAGC
ncbi:MAG TPA: hypothetical protein VF756_11070 [Thermoanaerobaculia bacterium]